jgi:hypothetical protein
MILGRQAKEGTRDGGWARGRKEAYGFMSKGVAPATAARTVTAAAMANIMAAAWEVRSNAADLMRIREVLLCRAVEQGLQLT